MTANHTLTRARIPGMILILLTLSLSAFAGIRDERSFQIQLDYTAILGPGISLSYNLGNHLAFGVDYYAAKLERDGENTENDETVEADFSTAEVFLKVYPFENSGFYFSVASVVRSWEVTVKGYESDIGDGVEGGNYEVTAEWPDTGVAYGLGFNWIADFGLSGGFFLGAVSGGEPELKGKVDNAAVTQADIDKHVDEIAEEENIDERYSTVGLIRVSIGYNF